MPLMQGPVGGMQTRPDLSDPMVNDPRTGRPIKRSELTARNAREALAEQTASARGEIYIPDPYGVGSATSGSGGGGSSSYGGGVSGGYSGAGSPAGNNVVTSPGGGGGSINLSRGSYENQQAMLLEDKLAREREQRALAALQGSSGAGTPRQVSYDTTGSDAARAAAFARAKEQAGQNAASAMRALEEVSSRRGTRGSTIEADTMGDIIQGGRGAVNDFTREQLIQDLENIQHIGDTTYQGNIAQRGQDVSARQAMLSILSGLY